MAADTQSKAVNGNAGVHYPYGPAEALQPSQSSNASTGTAVVSAYGDEAPTAPTATPSESATTAEVSKPPSKDEVGWYFVESYYTTMSKNPETLHLYYNKRSQFVSGVETEKVEVSVGQRAINDRIKELDFQDCKVRVSNVDSQESGKNIIVQVIGEISNKAAAHRKFVQAFVLAEQPKGYFVLNDIFRYILEDEEEEIENTQVTNTEPAPVPVAEPEPATLTSSNDPAEQEHAAEKIDKKLEEEVLQKQASANDVPAESAPANGYTESATAQVNVAEDAPAAAITETEAGEGPEQAAASVAKESEQALPEKPRDPDPTPVASPVKTTKAAPVENKAPAAAPKPAAPKTWANLVAANRVAPPAVPNGAPPTSAATSASSQNKAAPPSTAQSITPPAAARENSPAKGQQNNNAGWQMAGAESNKKQGRQHASSSASGNQEVFLGYVKNVTDKVDASILKSTLSQYGKLLYFDVNRPKNCAFVEFADSTAYNAAVAANPHSIGGEQIFVEERRPRANAYGGNNAQRGGMRGGRGIGDGRGGYPKDGGRGGYVPRGRGGNMTPRGRGQPQAA
ncbi:hypothetical protein ACLMJK_006575 [Lecanora helva]